jgi:Na+/glutamate symporter
MLTSAVIMAVLGVLSTKLKIRWLTDYALPLSLVGGMASAIFFTDLFIK